MTRLSPQEASAVALEHARSILSGLEMMMLKGPLQKIIGQLYASSAVGTGVYTAKELSDIIINQAVENGHNAGTIKQKVYAVVGSIYADKYYAAIGVESGFYIAKGD